MSLILLKIGMGRIAARAVGRVDEALEFGPPFLVALSHHSKPSSDAECIHRVALVLQGKISVGAPHEDSSCSEDDVELGVDGAIGLEGNGPNNNNKNCN